MFILFHKNASSQGLTCYLLMKVKLSGFLLIFVLDPLFFFSLFFDCGYHEFGAEKTFQSFSDEIRMLFFHAALLPCNDVKRSRV